MSNEQKLKLIEELNRYVEGTSSIVSASLSVPDSIEFLRVVVELATDRVEYTHKGSRDYAYMPKDGMEFNMRLITNPLRRICRKSNVDFSIVTPSRYYKSRKSTIKEFMGYDSPEVTLAIM